MNHEPYEARVSQASHPRSLHASQSQSSYSLLQLEQCTPEEKPEEIKTE